MAIGEYFAFDLVEYKLCGNHSGNKRRINIKEISLYVIFVITRMLLFSPCWFRYVFSRHGENTLKYGENILKYGENTLKCPIVQEFYDLLTKTVENEPKWRYSTSIYLKYGRNWLKAVQKIVQCRSRVVDPRCGENTRSWEYFRHNYCILFVFCCTENFTHYQVDSCWLVTRVFEHAIANTVKTIAITGIP